MARIGIIEKSPIVLRVLSELLEQDCRFELVVAVSDLESFLREDEARLDVLVSGWVGANGGGREVLRQAARLPRRRPNVVIYTGAPVRAIAHSAVCEGTRAVISRSTPPDRLLDSLWAVSLGRRVLPDRTSQPKIETLTRRESQVLDCASKGLSNNNISHRLDISVSTTKFHLRNIFDKLNVKNRTQAVATMINAGQGQAEETRQHETAIQRSGPPPVGPQTIASVDRARVMN